MPDLRAPGAPALPLVRVYFLKMLGTTLYRIGITELWPIKQCLIPLISQYQAPLTRWLRERGEGQYATAPLTTASFLLLDWVGVGTDRAVADREEQKRRTEMTQKGCQPYAHLGLGKRFYTILDDDDVALVPWRFQQLREHLWGEGDEPSWAGPRLIIPSLERSGSPTWEDFLATYERSLDVEDGEDEGPIDGR